MATNLRSTYEAQGFCPIGALVSEICFNQPGDILGNRNPSPQDAKDTLANHGYNLDQGTEDRIEWVIDSYDTGIYPEINAAWFEAQELLRDLEN